MPSSHLRRRCWIAIAVERGIWCVCAWRESILQAQSREEDLAMELSQHFFETWTGAVEVKAAGITSLY